VALLCGSDITLYIYMCALLRVGAPVSHCFLPGFSLSFSFSPSYAYILHSGTPNIRSLDSCCYSASLKEYQPQCCPHF
jgi:hypothetical protein